LTRYGSLYSRWWRYSQGKNAAKGHGKRGGARVIYYWVVPDCQIFMLLAYAKNEQENLSEGQLKLLRTLVKKEFDDGQ